MEHHQEANKLILIESRLDTLSGQMLLLQEFITTQFQTQFQTFCEEKSKENEGENQNVKNFPFDPISETLAAGALRNSLLKRSQSVHFENKLTLNTTPLDNTETNGNRKPISRAVDSRNSSPLVVNNFYFMSDENSKQKPNSDNITTSNKNADPNPPSSNTSVQFKKQKVTNPTPSAKYQNQPEVKLVKVKDHKQTQSGRQLRNSSREQKSVIAPTVFSVGEEQFDFEIDPTSDCIEVEVNTGEDQEEQFQEETVEDHTDTSVEEVSDGDSNYNGKSKSKKSSVKTPVLIQCSTCKKKFQTRFSLRRHQKSCRKGKSPRKRTRKAAPRLICRYCDLTFPEEDETLKHERNSHTDVLRFPCGSCLKAFVNQSNLDRHFLGHEDKSPFECLVCHKRSKQLAHVKSHLQRVHKINDPAVQLKNWLRHDY